MKKIESHVFTAVRSLPLKPSEPGLERFFKDHAENLKPGSSLKGRAQITKESSQIDHLMSEKAQSAMREIRAAFKRR